MIIIKLHAFAVLLLASGFCTAIGYSDEKWQYYHRYRPDSPVPSFDPRHKDLISVFEWRNLVFGFPSERERQLALSSGRFNPDAPFPIDVDVYYPPKGKPRYFVTAPRRNIGVPYSLAEVTNIRRENGTELTAFPCYEMHKSNGDDCDGITSVFRVHIDPCGQMWILDTGEISFQQRCSPQVLVIDLATNELVHRYRLPNTTYNAGVSRLVTIIADIADPPPQGICKKAFIYIADPPGRGIIVYDVMAGNSWRIQNKYTYPDPNFSPLTIAGESFELLDGALAIALTPRNLGLKRMLYFHALANELEVAIPLDVVNNASNWRSGVSSSINQFIPLGRRGVQCGASAISKDGIWWCGFLNPIGIFGWDIRTPYTAKNVQLLALNPQTLQFVSGMKVIRRPDNGREELWMLSDRLQKLFGGAYNYTEINFRVMRCDVADLLSGRPCRR